MKRTESREAAFLLLFEACFKLGSRPEELISLKTEDEFSYDGYTLSLAGGVMDSLEHLDEIINTYSNSWKSGRLSKVALTALRMAIYEIEQSQEDELEAVYINEAVNLIKKYDGIESAKYANGILGAYVGKK